MSRYTIFRTRRGEWMVRRKGRPLLSFLDVSDALQACEIIYAVRERGATRS